METFGMLLGMNFKAAKKVFQLARSERIERGVTERESEVAECGYLQIGSLRNRLLVALTG